MPNFFNKYPYTDFHELNLDWILETVKQCVEEWAATLTEWNNTKEEWDQLYTYVHDYFDNLDVQDEIDNKLDEMAINGTLAQYVGEYLGFVTPEMFGAVGDGITDDTEALRTCLASQGMILGGKNKTYLVSCSPSSYALQMSSDTIFDLNNSIIKLAANDKATYELISVVNCQNVIIKNGTIIGDVDTHTGATGEWGHCIAITDTDNCTIDNCTIKDGWGDGIYIGSGSSNIKVLNSLVDHNGRNNISVVDCNTGTIDNCILSNAFRTAPKSGLDIEPNNSTDSVVDFTVCNTTFKDNQGGSGMGLYNGASNNIVFDNIVTHEQIAIIDTNTAVDCISLNNIVSYKTILPFKITNEGNAKINIKADVYAGTESDIYNYLIQLFNKCVSLDADIRIITETGSMLNGAILPTGAGPFEKLSVKCHYDNAARLATFADIATDTGLIVTEFDKYLDLTASTVLPRTGGKFRFTLSGAYDFYIPTHVQRGTKFIFANEGTQYQRLNNLFQIAANHYVVFEAVDFDVLAKTCDIAFGVA